MKAAVALLGSMLGVTILTPGPGAAQTDLNDAGKAAYERGDYVVAERLFTEAVTREPRDPLLHYHRGVALMRLSRWREASTAFEAVLRLDPPPDLAAMAQKGIRSLAPLLREPTPSSARIEETLVGLQRVGGNWMADVRLNNSRTARFVVDTGASACVLSPDLAVELGIHPGAGAETVPMRVVGGATAGPRVTVASVRAGDAEVENVAAVIHPIGPGIDGLLGNTFLGRFTVTLDPRRGILLLRPR
jgi:clan AA aspartic protease (TIGR02281 family)